MYVIKEQPLYSVYAVPFNKDPFHFVLSKIENYSVLEIKPMNI